MSGKSENNNESYKYLHDWDKTWFPLLLVLFSSMSSKTCLNTLNWGMSYLHN